MNYKDVKAMKIWEDLTSSASSHEIHKEVNAIVADAYHEEFEDFETAMQGMDELRKDLHKLDDLRRSLSHTPQNLTEQRYYDEQKLKWDKEYTSIKTRIKDFAGSIGNQRNIETIEERDNRYVERMTELTNTGVSQREAANTIYKEESAAGGVPPTPGRIKDIFHEKKRRGKGRFDTTRRNYFLP